MNFLNRKTAVSIPITPVSSSAFDAWLKKQPQPVKNQVSNAKFTGAGDTCIYLHDQNGQLERVVFGTGDDSSLYTYASLPGKLPKNSGGYYIDKQLPKERATQAALGWALGSYQFTRYRSNSKKDFADLVWPVNADHTSVKATAEAVFLVRDLVNTPSNDLGPAELAEASRKLARKFNNSSIKVITGKDLKKKNFPMIYAVGQGSPREPRLIDIQWGNEKHPQITLIGKGVCFDTGGLDLKPGSAMALMKKDMGGAAHVLGLAHMIMSTNLPVRLRVLIPAVENATDGNSYRPGDIWPTRKGLTVEIGDTDAEGRLVLADALTLASEGKPDLIIDFATLTGAARVALGPEIPAMFSNNDKIANALMDSASKEKDPLWRLPLWQPYNDSFASKIADTNNVGGQAGAIIAALFLQKFVDKDIPWVHIDTFAWNNGGKPGRPEGGEALGMRASYDLIKKTFGRKH